jgi:Ca2+-transporting ATPase
MPVHIVLLELLIDPACSIVFEAEPESADIMHRPPRPADSSPFAVGNIVVAVVQGIGAAVLLLVGYGVMLGLGIDAMQSRTAVFGALVIGLFALILANRDPAHALMAHGGMGNRWLRLMFVGIVLVLALATGVPYLREVMGLALPTLASLTGTAILLVLTFFWLEGLRLALHAFGQRKRPAPARENP